MTEYNFKNYFKFPLIQRENFPYVLTNDGKTALTWLIDLPNEERIEIVNKINGYSSNEYDEEWEIKENIFLYYKGTKIFFVRGWGMLTGIGGYNLNPSIACKIQNNFANYILNNLNRKEHVKE